MATVASEERKSDSVVQGKYHFTIVDHKPEVIARDLLVLVLLGELSEILSEKSATSERAVLITTTLFFVYNAQIMPSFAFAYLQETITKTILGLQAGAPSFPWLDVRNDQAVLIGVLRTWQNLINYDIPKGCETEIKLFWETALLPPPAVTPSKHGPQLANLLNKASLDCRKSGKPSKVVIKQINKHIKDHWHTNVSSIDIHANKFFSQHPGSTHCWIAPFFIGTARALQQLKRRVIIEAIVGEVTQIVDQITNRIGCRSAQSQGGATRDYPHVYQVVHLSNVPDYVGGHLTSFLHAFPILQNAACPGTIKSTCLRNSLVWKSLADFDNEYLLTGTTRMQGSAVYSLFRVKPPTKAPEPGDPVSLAEYHEWTRFDEKRIEFSAKATPARESLERWLYAIFLKSALPVQQDLQSPSSYSLFVYSPLNLNVFFRIIEYIQRLGWPAHWISGVLSDIVTNNVTTTVRPPRSVPLSRKEAQTVFPARKIKVAAFVAEMSTLAALWSRTLKLGIAVPGLPPLESVWKYRVKLKQVPLPQFQLPVYILVFHRRNLSSVEYLEVVDLRKFLLDDESVRHSPIVHKMRQREQVVMVTTFTWDAKKNKAEFWLRKDMMDLLEKDKNWQCILYDTVDWTPHGRATTVKYGREVEEVCSWLGQENPVEPDGVGDESDENGSTSDDFEDFTGLSINGDDRFMENERAQLAAMYQGLF
ncbi:hypothetical protein EJ08DRAFT_739021 [Tothia fuscella]|uniref:Uncharacterized protein n=1 Tax=Tothia fuscella TaxID=1048955 RepID=A0A9P4TSN7_9PEZI|nr:hypothetical protein EJ08DRAFT_739021 [Tothia fuscella]